MEHNNYTSRRLFGFYTVEYNRAGWENWARMFCGLCKEDTGWIGSAAEFADALVSHNHDDGLPIDPDTVGTEKLASLNEVEY